MDTSTQPTLTPTSNAVSPLPQAQAQGRKEQEQAMADTGERRQATFTKVEGLRPGGHGLNLILKVLNSKMVQNRTGAPQGRQQIRLAECLVGDETGIIVFTARNDQVDAMKPGATVEVKNTKVDMYKGSMRLAVDKRGIIKASESPSELKVKEDNNLSLIEFELFTVVE